MANLVVVKKTLIHLRGNITSFSTINERIICASQKLSAFFTLFMFVYGISCISREELLYIGCDNFGDNFAVHFGQNKIHVYAKYFTARL